MFKTALLAFVLVAAVAANHPPDLPCVTWEPLNANQPTPDPNSLFVSAYTWVVGYGVDDCFAKGDIFPCWSADPEAQTWGHHDYQPSYIPSDSCRSWVNGSVYFSQNMYVPKKGPKYETWKWQLAQTGGKIPDNAIRYGNKVMAQNTIPPSGWCFGKGNVGWAIDAGNDRFGKVHFSIVNHPITMTNFKVAVCKAYHPTPAPTPAPTPVPPTPAPATPNPPTPQPTTPSPTASPTLPPDNKPYVRFGNTVPSANKVDAVVTQGNVSYTWSNYGFSEFSHWVEIFKDGFGTIDIYESNNGARGKKLMTKTIPLTPGPLVIVTRDLWPPHEPWNVETIAASYVPSHDGKSGVRLFNLSPDTPSAGMNGNGKQLVDGVKYSIGSDWAPVDPDEMTFAVFDDNTKKTLAQDTFVPPPSPFVFTNFLIGMQNATSKAYSTQLVPLIDAPEQ